MTRTSLAMLLIFLTASLPAQELCGFLKQTPPIEFGGQLSNSEMLTLISIVENRRWASQSSDLQSIRNKIPMGSILYGLGRPFFYVDEQNVHLRKGLFAENG